MLVDKSDYNSAQSILEADLWVKENKSSMSPYNFNSSLHSIEEESEVSSINDYQHNKVDYHKSEFKKPKSICIEIISPPKKCALTKCPLKKISPKTKKLSPINKKGKNAKDKSSLDAISLKKKLQLNKSVNSK